MEALGYPPLSNLGTAVHSLPCLKDTGLINPVHNQLSLYLITTCIVVCCGLGFSHPERLFVTPCTSLPTRLHLPGPPCLRSFTFTSPHYASTLPTTQSCKSPTHHVRSSHAVPHHHTHMALLARGIQHPCSTRQHSCVVHTLRWSCSCMTSSRALSSSGQST